MERLGASLKFGQIWLKIIYRGFLFLSFNVLSLLRSVTRSFTGPFVGICVRFRLEIELLSLIAIINIFRHGHSHFPFLFTFGSRFYGIFHLG